MKKRWILIVVCVVLIVVLGGWTYRGMAVTPVEEAVGQFFSLLAAGDVEGAKDLAAGQTLYLLSRPQDTEIPSGKVVRQDVEVTALGDDWAQARATVEIELADRSVDVQWYVISLVKEGKWKVNNVREDFPVLRGSLWNGVDESDVEEARMVFEGYLNELAANRYREAAGFLVGPARKAHELGEPALSKARVITEIGELEFVPAWQDESFLVARVSYRADGRPVEVTVTLYKTIQGWRIADVAQN